MPTLVCSLRFVLVLKRFMAQLETNVYPWCLPFRNNSFDCLGGRGIEQPEVRAMVAKISRAIGLTVFVMILGFNPHRESGHYSQVYQPYREILEYDRIWPNI